MPYFPSAGHIALCQASPTSGRREAEYLLVLPREAPGLFSLTPVESARNKTLDLPSPGVRVRPSLRSYHAPHGEEANPMQSSQQFCNLISHTISRAATALAMTIVVFMTVVVAQSAHAQTFNVLHNFTD